MTGEKGYMCSTFSQIKHVQPKVLESPELKTYPYLIFINLCDKFEGLERQLCAILPCTYASGMFAVSKSVRMVLYVHMSWLFSHYFLGCFLGISALLQVRSPKAEKHRDAVAVAVLYDVTSEVCFVAIGCRVSGTYHRGQKYWLNFFLYLKQLLGLLLILLN